MKKLLALVLAMVMTLGLATVGASAAAYTDAADIDYTEAVDVMSALKVLDGQNGAFNPNGILTREQGAKIIAYMILGKSAADSLTTAKSSFADVAPERWSAGAIEYCVSTKIVGGAGKDTNGNDVFNPEAELTGHAFAKMCLVALGYNPNYETFVGGDWAINVAKVALSSGLNDKLDIVMSKGITRQQAAQMALNTMKATMVDYENPINVKGGDGMEVTVGAKRSDVENTSSNYRNDVGTDNKMQFVERYYKNPALKLDANGTDSYGRPANVWTLGNKEVGKYGKTPTVTYTGAVKGGTLYTDLGSAAMPASFYTVADQYKHVSEGNMVKNGASDAYGAVYHTTDVANIVSGNQSTVAGGTGIKTEVYFSRTDPYLYIIESRTFLAKALAAYNTTNGKLPVALDSTTFGAKVTEIEGASFPAVVGAAKDEYFYVTLTTNTDGAQTGATVTLKSVEKVPATAFVSDVKLTAQVSGSSITANGTAYSLAKSLEDTQNGTAFTLGTTSYDLILDKDGNVLGQSLHSSDTQYVDKYVFLSNADKAGLSYQAELIKMDGTKSNVTVSKVKGDQDSASGSITGVAEYDVRTGSNAHQLQRGAFYTYSIGDNGDYTLTYANTYVSNTSTQLVKNDASAFVASINKVVNSKTAFVAGSASNLNAYLGIANFPGMSGTGAVYAVNDATSVVPAVYTAVTPASTSTSKYVYVFGGSQGSTREGSTNYSTAFTFMDGVLSAERMTLSDNSNMSNGLFKVSYDTKNRLELTSGGTYVRGNSIATYETAAGAVYVTNGVVTLVAAGHSKTESGYNYNAALNSEAEFYYIDANTSPDGRVNSAAMNSATASVKTQQDGGTYNIFLFKTSSSDSTIKQVWIIANEGC